MRSINRISATVAFLSLIFTLSVASQNPTPDTITASTDEANIKRIITAFFEDFAKKDLEAIRVMWSTESTYSTQQLKEIEKAFADYDQIEFKDVSYSTLSMTGETAVIRVKLQQTAIDSKTHQTSNVLDTDNRIFELTRQKDIWKIVRHISAESYMADSLVEIQGEAQRLAFIDANKDLNSRVFVRALITKGKQAHDEENAALTITMLELALTVSNRWGDLSQLKSILPGLAYAYHRFGEFGRSLEVWQRALELGREMKDPDYESKMWLNMGIEYATLGDYRKLIELTNKRLSYAESTGDNAEMLRALINIGNGYGLLGDYYKEFECQTRAQELIREIGEKDPKILKSEMTAALLMNMGELYKHLGDTDLALEYNLKSLKINEEDGTQGAQYAGILINMGNVYVTRGDYPRAIEQFEKAFRRSEILTDRGGMAAAAEGIGNVYWEKGDYKAALEYHLKALKIREDSESHVRIDVDRLNVAFDQYKIGDFASALALVQDITRRPKRDDFDVGSAPANLLEGMVYHATGELDKSDHFLAEAISITEKERNRYGGNGRSTLLFSNSSVTPYYEMIKLRMDQKRPVESFAFGESAKARSLLDVLSNGKFDISKSMTPDEVVAEQKLRVDIVSANAQLSNENGRPKPDHVRVSELQNVLKQKQLELDAFQAKLYSSHPDLRVQRAEMKPISLDETAALMSDEKTAVAEFVVADDKTFLFVITKDSMKKASLKVFTLNVKDKDLAKRVEAYRSKLAAGELDFGQYSRELFELLLKPAAAQLAGKTNLIIVPDGPLWDLPFQALQDQKGKYLTEQAAVSYAPSLTALKEMTRKGKSRTAGSGAELIAFGNPVVGKDTSDRVKQVFMDEKLEPLPESERLVNELSKMYGPDRSKVYLGGDAREATAKTEAPKYRIVQFATHGILNNASPMYSHLVLARNEKDASEDGLLEAWEMKDLDLKADMVILSACDTARGKISNGEGVIGMSWALFIAGTPTTVASQWKVESSSTTELMLEFHRQLLAGKGISKAEALRRAELKLLRSKQYSHPSYWAPFVIVGDGS